MLPVLRPDLPTAAELLPYLERITDTGQASNGPLVRELEAQTGGTAVANATLGLELAARFTWGSGVVRVPALTFPATATAIIRAGLTPYLVDVDPDTWAARPDERTLVVSPFGYPTSGLLTDSAGCAPPWSMGDHVISLHATKPVPAGEGGLVLGAPELQEYVARMRNFGLANGTVGESGTNAKLSEYHAAVALASLDRYQGVAERRRQLAARYVNNLKGRVTMRPYAGGTLFPVLMYDPHGAQRRLMEAGIESRRWYCPTLDMHPAFEQCPRDPLPIAHGLAMRLLCLPFHTFMTDADVDRVSEVLCEF